MVLNKLFYSKEELKHVIEKSGEIDNQKAHEIQVLENLFTVKNII